jgi:hypothetical protein
MILWKTAESKGTGKEEQAKIAAPKGHPKLNSLSE